jgi:hypothetical protein
MKNILNKLFVPVSTVIVINIIGLIYHTNFEGAVIGSITGMVVGIIVNEIRAKFE